MEPAGLKEKYGYSLTFWGGAVDGQTTMAGGTPDDVEHQLRENIEILRNGGGVVCSVVHNLQNNYELENVQRVLDVVREYR